MHPRSRGAMRPRFCKTLSLQRKREQGRPGTRCTRGLVRNVHREVRTRAYRFSGGAPTFPAQWLYGLYRALPGDEFVLSPSPTDERFIEPGRVRKISASLTPATGARTTRFCRTQLPVHANRLRPKADFGG